MQKIALLPLEIKKIILKGFIQHYDENIESDKIAKKLYEDLGEKFKAPSEIKRKEYKVNYESNVTQFINS